MWLPNISFTHKYKYKSNGTVLKLKKIMRGAEASFVLALVANVHAHTHTHTHACTHIQTHFTHTHTHMSTHTHTYTHMSTHTHIHTHTLSLSLALSLSRARALSLSLTHTHKYARERAHTHIHTHTNTQTSTHSNTHTHSLTNMHTLSHTHQGNMTCIHATSTALVHSKECFLYRKCSLYDMWPRNIHSIAALFLFLWHLPPLPFSFLLLPAIFDLALCVCVCVFVCVQERYTPWGAPWTAHRDKALQVGILKHVLYRTCSLKTRLYRLVSWNMFSTEHVLYRQGFTGWYPETCSLQNNFVYRTHCCM